MVEQDYEKLKVAVFCHQCKRNWFHQYSEPVVFVTTDKGQQWSKCKYCHKFAVQLIVTPPAAAFLADLMRQGLYKLN